MLNASKIQGPSTSNFVRPEPLEAGTYPVRVVQVLTLGLQEQRPYKGEAKEPREQLYVTYEFADEFMKDEDGNDDETKPRWLSEDFPFHSLQAELAKSTKRYFALDPANAHGGDWTNLIGAAGMLTIVQNPSRKDPEVIYNNIAGLSSMRAKDADKLEPLINTGKVFDIDEPDMEVFNSLPQWLQDKMTKENLRFGGSALEAAMTGDAPKASKKPAPAADDEEDW